MHQSNWKNPAYIYAHLYGVHICGLCCIASSYLLYLVMECITVNDSPCMWEWTPCPHMYNLYMRRHIIWQLNIKYIVNSIVMHRSARQFPLCFCVWKHTCYVCLGPLSLLSMSLYCSNITLLVPTHLLLYVAQQWLL